MLSFPGKVLAGAERERLFIADTNHIERVRLAVPISVDARGASVVKLTYAIELPDIKA